MDRRRQRHEVVAEIATAESSMNYCPPTIAMGSKERRDLDAAN